MPIQRPEDLQKKKEALLAEDTSCASWALKGGILKNNVIDQVSIVNPSKPSGNPK